jgi:hypothetical protein
MLPASATGAMMEFGRSDCPASKHGLGAGNLESDQPLLDPLGYHILVQRDALVLRSRECSMVLRTRWSPTIAMMPCLLF